MHYFLSAGEASGDLHAAPLIAAIRTLDNEACFTFLGGDLMAEAAATPPLIHYRHMAYMGFSEVIRHLPQVFANLRTAREAVSRERPSCLILIDYPSFNLKLAAHAHDLGIPVYWYIAPKVWAWKEYRVKTIRRLVRRVLSILPFETEFFQSHGIDARYVGNPSLEEIDARLISRPTPDEIRRAAGVTSDLPLLALVPGSRKGEIRNNLPVMQAVASLHPGLQPVVAGAPGIDPAFYTQFTSFPVIDNLSFRLMAAAEAALVTSGTATLECALAATPQVVCYRANGSRLSYAIMKRLIHTRYVSLPNLIADAPVIPEMLLHHCNVTEVNDRLTDILSGAPGQRRQLDGYTEIRRRLGTSRAASTAAAEIIDDLVTLQKHQTTTSI
ncbi:lipid-A-disaccharide synthase [Paramuribaculum intestinale]|uniref:lipid-A-disaccharide synthase n=1 Tax=Paramuribaculum intestinale TaxID=2094151 RepID=UPI00272B22CA|nr:lipid-A-disaccharide synthase [Paramuribaculum intestinale]